MTKYLLVLTLLLLAGCQSMYDDQAYTECDRSASTWPQRQDCYDHVDRNSRDRQQFNAQAGR